MKLTPELKERINSYFDNITPQELLDKAINKFGFEVIEEDVFEIVEEEVFGFSNEIIKVGFQDDLHHNYTMEFESNSESDIFRFAA